MLNKIVILILLFSLSLTISTTNNVRAQTLSDQNQNTVFEYTPNYNNLYKFLKITEEDYTNSLKKGKSMAEIAESQGISKQSLINFLRNEMTAQLDKQLNEGKLNKESHTQIKNNLNRAIEDDINYRTQKPKENLPND